VNPEPFMNPEEFSSFVNWHGDRPSLVGGGENKNAEVHSMSRKEGQVDNEETQVENAPARPLRAANESEPEPLKTQYIISSYSKED